MAGAGLVVFEGAQAGAAAGDGTVTVRVIREINANGTWENAAPVVEPGIAGATVRLSDPDGHELTARTDGQGLVTFRPDDSDLTGGKYRVDVSNPAPAVLQPAFAAGSGTPSAGKLSATVEFVDVSGNQPATVTTGFWNPHDYAQADPRIISAHQVDPVINPLAKGSIYSDSYVVNSSIGQVEESTQAETGTVYGIGWNRSAKIVYAGAYAKRGAPYGPAGPGAIYWTDPATGQGGTFAVVPDAGTTQHHHQLLAPDNHDVAFVGVPGKESLGDVEVSEDGKHLYAVNFGDRKLYVYDIAPDGRSGALARAVAAPAGSCATAADWRPGALGMRDGKVFLGGVCSGETGGRSSLRSVVWQYDAADLTTAPTKVLDQTMAYARGSTWPYPCPTPADPNDPGQWYAWTDTTPACATNLNSFYPQPLLLDIEFEITGEMLLSYRDRWGDQYGVTTLSTQLDRFVQSAAMGDLLRACPDSAGVFVIDENGGCGDLGARGEFYDDDSMVAAFHPEAAFSGIALAYDEATIVANAIDVTATFELDAANMSRTGTGGLLNTGWTNSEVQAPSGFLKGNGLADIEVMADQAPLQIGNRLWFDTDGDGHQDADEAAAPAGIRVRLTDGAGAEVATTVTDDRGEYYFDSLTDDVEYGTEYGVRVDDPQDFAPGGALDSNAWVLTVVDAGTGPEADQVDSDAVPKGGHPYVPVTTGGAGENDHRYDIGFVPSAPAIDIVDVDGRVDVPQDAVDGPDPVGGGQTVTADNWTTTADADTPATAVRYDVDGSGSTGPQPVRFVVTNTGNVTLGDVEVSEDSTGPALSGVQCDFPEVGGTSNGTTWSGPFAPGASFRCTATVTLRAGEEHANTARVTAVPVDRDGEPVPGGPTVDDEDQFHAVAERPAPVLTPAIDIVDVDGRAEVPANPVDGADPAGGGMTTTGDNWAAGVDADTEGDAVVYQVGDDGSTGPQPVRFVVTNTGTAPLGEVMVAADTLAGPDLADLVCAFPMPAMPGTTWNGPFAVGASFECTATVTLTAGEKHGNLARVIAVGLDAEGDQVADPQRVDDEDRFRALAADPEPVRTPAIDIVDVDGRAEVPVNPVDGADPAGGGQTHTPFGWPAGVDADNADDAVRYDAADGSTGPQPVRFVVTNTGTAPLGEVEVSADTLAGPDLADLVCAFPMPATPGTSWDGPFAVGASFECSATVTLDAGEQHANRARVTAVELDGDGNPVAGPRTVDDEDEFHAVAAEPVPVLTPAIDIVDVDGRAEVPANPVDGADPVGGVQSETPANWPVAVDADQAADAVIHEVLAGTSTKQPVRFVVTNTGTAPLGDIEVSQKTLAGPDLTGLVCAFPMPATPGTSWDGPFAVGASFECTADLTLAAGAEHADLARVTAVELDADGEPVQDARTVGDEDRFHAVAVAPGVDIAKQDGPSGAEADGSADAVAFDPGETRTVTMPVQNTGDTALLSVRVTDHTGSGPAMRGFECRFPGHNKWTPATNGTVTWAESFPGDEPAVRWRTDSTFTCRGELTMPAGAPEHASSVRVTAVSPGANPVSAADPFHASVRTVPVPEEPPVIDPPTGTTLPEVGGPPAWLGLLGAALVAGGLVLARRGPVRPGRHRG